MTEKLLICCQKYYFMMKNVFETFQIGLFILFFIIFLILLIRIGILNASPALKCGIVWASPALKSGIVWASPALKSGILRASPALLPSPAWKELVHQLLIFLFFTCIFCVRLELILGIHKTTNTRWHFRLLIMKHTFHYCCSIVWFGLTLCNFDRKTFIIEFHPLKFRLGSPVFLLKSAKLQLTITNLNNTNDKQNKTFQLLLIKILSSCKTFYSLQS